MATIGNIISNFHLQWIQRDSLSVCIKVQTKIYFIRQKLNSVRVFELITHLQMHLDVACLTKGSTDNRINADSFSCINLMVTTIVFLCFVS